MPRSIPTPFTDKIRPGPNNDPETFCAACGENPAQLDLTDEDYDRAIAHTEFAGKTLRRAKQAAQDNDSATAGSLTSVAMHHMLHGHQALKGAHYSRDGNYLAAAKASHDCAKALCLAKYAFDREKGMRSTAKRVCVRPRKGHERTSRSALGDARLGSYAERFSAGEISRTT